MRERVLIRAELFLEVYTAFTIAYRENGGIPSREQIRSIIRQYLSDYAEDEMTVYLEDKLVKGSPGIYDLQIRSIYGFSRCADGRKESAGRLFAPAIYEQILLRNEHPRN